MIDRMIQRGRILGAVLLLIGTGIGFTNPSQFFHSYLFGFSFVLGLSLGSLAILMIYHLSGGRWGAVIRSLLEASIRVIPYLAILFIPVILGMKHLYSWTDPAIVKADEILQKKSLYLNTGFFVVRAVIYFGIWIFYSIILNRLTNRQAVQDSSEVQNKFHFASGIGLVLYGLTMSFAAVDWLMSMDPHWFSTMFGLLLIAGQVLAAFAIMIAIAAWLLDTKPFGEVISPEQFHDLGKLMLAFVMIWAYLAISQFLIIWAGNLSDEIPWYVQRLRGGWQGVALSLVLLHFTLPFLLLLSRGLKRNPRGLVPVAIGLLVMRLVDLYWLIAPGLHGGELSIHVLDLMLPAGLIALWLSLFGMQLKKRPLLPVNDPNLPEPELKLREAH